MGRLLPLLALLLVACYETPKPACLFLCGQGGACPEGYECSADDNRCHLVESGGGLAACPDPLPFDAALEIDAAEINEDAPPVDATPIDAEEPDAATSCADSLAPTDDMSTGAPQTLVISEINPGEYIEVYNDTDAAIDLDNVAFQLCAQPAYIAVSAAGVGAGITVEAGSYAQLGWPSNFGGVVDGSGEVALYANSDFADGANIMDFVCWGTATAQTRKDEAEGVGKWTGACAAAPTMGAVHRLVATDGVDAADYDVTAAPSPMTCTPM